MFATILHLHILLLCYEGKQVSPVLTDLQLSSLAGWELLQASDVSGRQSRVRFTWLWLHLCAFVDILFVLWRQASVSSADWFSTSVWSVCGSVQVCLVGSCRRLDLCARQSRVSISWLLLLLCAFIDNLFVLWRQASASSADLTWLQGVDW